MCTVDALSALGIFVYNNLENVYHGLQGVRYEHREWNELTGTFGESNKCICPCQY